MIVNSAVERINVGINQSFLGYAMNSLTRCRRSNLNVWTLLGYTMNDFWFSVDGHSNVLLSDNFLTSQTSVVHLPQKDGSLSQPGQETLTIDLESGYNQLLVLSSTVLRIYHLKLTLHSLEFKEWNNTYPTSTKQNGHFPDRILRVRHLRNRTAHI